MTLAELERAISSKRRVEMERLREKASFNYKLADLIGRSIARIYLSSAKMPDIDEAYPSLYKSQEIEEQKQENKTNLSVLRFKQFAQSHNKKFIKEVQK